MTVAELLARVSSAELTEWQAFLRIEHEDAQALHLEQEAARGLRRR